MGKNMEKGGKKKGGKNTGCLKIKLVTLSSNEGWSK
jgi:hypothetical protein